VGRLPNFFVVGANRAGTTSLYRHLRSHPDVYMSPKKEPSYFAFSGGSEPTPPYWDKFLHVLALDEEEYGGLFAAARSEAAIGEASTAYLDSSVAAARIRTAVPDARIVMSLRDPVECFESRIRALQHWKIHRWDDLDKALRDHEAGKGDNFFYYRYHDPVKRWLDLFGRDRVKIILFDDLVRDPGRVVRDLYAFLDVDPTFVPPGLGTRFNHAPAAGDMQLTPEIRRHVIEHTRDDTARLSELIQRDLRNWTCFRASGP
jgi:sulfotransferase family protein